MTVDPSTGVARQDREPLRTLRQHRLVDPEKDPEMRKALGESPFFAVNYTLLREGEVAVGDDVYVEIK